ncbi:MAG: hypothetical protein HPY45_17470 [Anaerolineae bacterium]|nr:hypothetical protein [Anaerolineae bacterium]
MKRHLLQIISLWIAASLACTWSGQAGPTAAPTAAPAETAVSAPPATSAPPAKPPAASPCGNGICEGPENPKNCPADCPPPTAPSSAPSMPAPSPAAAQQDAVLYMGIMVHLEGWNDGEEQERFERHAEKMRAYASLFERYGAKLTWESKEVTEGIIRWGDNVLLEMEQRGHGVGVHADVGGQASYNCKNFAADLRAKKEQLESLGVTVRHVSGIVSHCDWVTAAAEAGYLFTTGQVAYAVMSMPPDQRPPEYRNCPSPSACHDIFPPELADRLHPWRMNSGSDWLNDAPNGRLVMLPASGGLAYMGQNEEFTQADVDAAIAELEQAIALAQPGRVNTYYLGWSLGKALDENLLENWLERIQRYVAEGSVQWKTLPEMYDAYIASGG